MLGVVGDLGSKRIIAWEISSEIDIQVLQNEVNSFLSNLSFSLLDEGIICASVKGEHCYSFDNPGYIYIDLWRQGFLEYLSRDDFYKRFKRAF